MKIFLDVGAYNGDTAGAVLKHNYNFDKIYCFEPFPKLCSDIRSKIKDEKVVVNEFGLWKENSLKKIFKINSRSASIFEDKFNEPVESQDISLVKASDWFKNNISLGDEVFLKLNCEGSECDILDDLIDSGESKKVSVLMVDFDVRKIPSQKHREKETRERLKKSGISVVIPVEKRDERMWRKKHVEYTYHWIDKAINIMRKEIKS
jgi:FkbM family methyltransferase